MVKLILGEGGLDFDTSFCSCPSFLKTYICKNILGVAEKAKIVASPPEAKDVSIGENRKRGRPKM